MDWATKRRLIYLGSIGAFIVIVAFWYIYPKLNVPPTCSDGKQNGTEAGIDCGGSCKAACFFQANDISIKWTKAFHVSDGLYNVVAYAENQNAAIGVESIKYEFKLYDENNIFITQRDGETFIGPNSRTPIFEAGVNTGNRTPKRVSFTFLEDPNWIQADARTSELPVTVTDTALFTTGTTPSLNATLHNDSIYAIQNTDIDVVLYDKDGNAVAASKTLVEQSAPHSTQKLYFTWPESFAAPVERIEIIPRVNVFSISF